jgi:probable 2-oxoglutarate dehydrogenase E1 component DHKTD1
MFNRSKLIQFSLVQEISPFPYTAVSKALDLYKSAKSFVWAQDEPENAGAFTFVLPRLQQILPRGAELEYVGREAMATVAPGVKSYFEEQKREIEEEVFEGL